MILVKKITIQLKYEDMEVSEFPKTCYKCPSGFISKDCGRKYPLSVDNRPDTCKLELVNISTDMNKVHNYYKKVKDKLLYSTPDLVDRIKCQDGIYRNRPLMDCANVLNIMMEVLVEMRNQQTNKIGVRIAHNYKDKFNMDLLKDKIVMAFTDPLDVLVDNYNEEEMREDNYKYFTDNFTGEGVHGYYIFDTPEEFIKIIWQM